MSEKNVTIAVSILTADFLNLENTLDRIIKAKIPAIHFDVMDNNFVPNLSFGPKILSDVVNYVKNKHIDVDCHLMVAIKKKVKVKDFLQPFIIEGVNSITLHYEALTKKQLLEFINWDNPGFKKGLALNPNSSVTKVFPFVEKLDFVLIMSVTPGFGKQTFIDNSYKKIQDLRQYLKTKNKQLLIGVDGGINDNTAKICLSAGANYLVSGSYLLNSDNSIKKQLEKLLS